jgi:asparaginyl-tRNA synthetase
MGDVYTFGPTFRAENSHTSRHLAEFWMIEPELSFIDFDELKSCAEDYLKYCLKFALANNRADIEMLEKFEHDNELKKKAKDQKETKLIDRLQQVIDTPFVRLTYTEAIEELKKVEKKAKFQVKVEWGIDLGSEHERYLVEKIYNGPVILTDYPMKIKAFYMRLNDDKTTCQAMDVLAPEIGEIIGGSMREERLDVLDEMIVQKGLNIEQYDWYRELRKFGTIPHGGFGLGFERLVMMATGIENIRDVIPFPRWPGNADF